MKRIRITWSALGFLTLALLLSSCQKTSDERLNAQLLVRSWGLKSISSPNDSLNFSIQVPVDSIRFYNVAKREAIALPGQGLKAKNLDYSAFSSTSGIPGWVIPKSGIWTIKDSSLIIQYNLPFNGMPIDSILYSSDGLAVDYKPFASGKELSINGSNPQLTQQWVIETLSSTQLTLFNPETSVRMSFSHQAMIAADGQISWTGIGRGILGMIALIFIAWIFSANRRAISWKVVGIGILIQASLALGVLKVAFIKGFFEFVGKIFVVILDFTRDGSTFLLGGFLDANTYGFIFMFQVLPTIIFFSALTSLLFYLGIIQKVVYALAWLLTKALKISGAESLAVAGNIFLGQTEAPLMIKAYLEKMNKSEILMVMTGGMATMAGGVLAAYISFLGGDDPIQRLIFAKHLLAASVMAAPGAVVVSKILLPQTEAIDMSVKISREKVGSNALDAISNGTTEGLKLAANVAAMLLVFIAFIAMFNFILLKTGQWADLNSWVADVTDGRYDKLSLQFLLGYLFAPIMWLIGIAGQDILLAGRLLGEKIIMTEFIGYVSLAELKASGAFMFEKSIIMSTYMLCGFANFASIGIQIGGIGSLAPNQRVVLSEFGMRALLGGTLAALISATMVGMILG